MAHLHLRRICQCLMIIDQIKISLLLLVVGFQARQGAVLANVGGSLDPEWPTARRPQPCSALILIPFVLSLCTARQ
jgi:hypothetical protein